MAKRSNSEKEEKRKKVKVLWENFYLEKFEEFAKKEHLSIDDYLLKLTELIEKPGMSLAVLHERYANSQMLQANEKNYDKITTMLQGFEKSFLTNMEINHKNNFDFAKENAKSGLELKTKENRQIDEIHEYLKEYIILDKGAGKDEALKIFERVAKKLDEKANAEAAEKKQALEILENKSLKSLFIEGIVNRKAVIDKTEKSVLFCFFTLAEKTSDQQTPISHNVFMWEGELTKKLGLVDKDSVTKYFDSINKGDYLNLKGYIKETKYKNKEGIEGTNISYQVTEVIKYKPYIKKD